MLFSRDYLLQGFVTAFSLQNLLWAVVGSMIGTLIGVLPGIGPSSGIAILLPLTTVLPPTSAIIMIAAIYYGAMYGGSTTAIVVNIPGEASSVPPPPRRILHAEAGLSHRADGFSQRIGSDVRDLFAAGPADLAGIGFDFLHPALFFSFYGACPPIHCQGSLASGKGSRP